MTATEATAKSREITTVGGKPADPNAPLLQVKDLRVEFATRAGTVVANDSVSYTLNSGETLAILGESGSGKSVSAQAVMGILDVPPGRIAGGQILYRGVDLLTLPESERRKLRGNNISIIFQDALTALNPVFTVGHQIAEMFRTHRGYSKDEARKASVELLDRVRIPAAKSRFDNYPHEFSGGMRQRAMIAMALALDPDILIADEPTTALDVTVQAQIMELLADLQSQTGMGLILITHDLGVVAEVAERVAVMYAGRIVEEGRLDDVFTTPAHPYTLGLMHSIPRADHKGQRLEPIQGSPPDLLRIPQGCSFHPRCEFVIDKCRSEEPPSVRVEGIGEGRRSACHRIQEVVAHG